MRSLKIIAMIVALHTVVWIIPRVASGQHISLSYQLFYDELSPYGQWIAYPKYGYVWIPDGDAGFSPYRSDGHWIYTEDGWTWVSDYSWGWATFHYGRWDYDSEYGWFWVPDDEWGPAWVSWRQSPGYFGWAPLRPGISVSMALLVDDHEQNDRWIFVRDRDIVRPDIDHYYLGRSDNGRIISRSTMIVNARRDESRGGTYLMGPARDDVQKATQTVVTSVGLRDNDRPGHRFSNGELYMYKPQIQKRDRDGNLPAPLKIVNLNDRKPRIPASDGRRQQQPGAVAPANTSDRPTPNAVPLPSKKMKSEQPPAVMPSKEERQPQPPADRSPDRKGRQQPAPAVNFPEREKVIPGRDIDRSNTRGTEKQQHVNPHAQSQDPRKRMASPVRENGKETPPAIAPPVAEREKLKPMEVNLNRARGSEKQQLKIAPPKKVDEPKPKAVKEEKEKKEK